jgi:hypothetical protein
MTPQNYESVIARIAALCPADSLASRAESRIGSLLAAGSIYLPPMMFSRFFVTLLLYPLAGELFALLLPRPQVFFIEGAFLLVQVAPFLFLLTLARLRQRSVDAEMPFFMMFMSIFSHSATTKLEDGLTKVAALGDQVLPAFTREARLVQRDLLYVPGLVDSTISTAFVSHPSKRLREFVRTLTVTLASGRSAVDVLDGEVQRQVGLFEAAWKEFGETIGSLAEVSLMVLALFPVGLEMAAASMPGLASDQMLLAAVALLAVFAGLIVFLMDSAQPILHNGTPPAFPIVISVLTWILSTLSFRAGFISVETSLLISMMVSALALPASRRVYRTITLGEEEVSALLHQLAEESKAGVSLPEALSKASSAGSFSSIRAPLAVFERSVMMGCSPEEAQRKVSHPSWLVRISFAMLSVAFVTETGYEKLEQLSTFFRRLSDARRNTTRSLLPFFLVGVSVPAISVTALTLLSNFNQTGVPFLPSFDDVSKNFILLSISAVSMMTGLILSKLYSLTSRYIIAVPLILAATLVSLLVVGLV